MSVWGTFITFNSFGQVMGFLELWPEDFVGLWRSNFHLEHGSTFQSLNLTIPYIEIKLKIKLIKKINQKFCFF